MSDLFSPLITSEIYELWATPGNNITQTEVIARELTDSACTFSPGNIPHSWLHFGILHGLDDNPRPRRGRNEVLVSGTLEQWA